MSGISAWVLTMALLAEHNGHWIAQQFDRPEVREIVPIGFVLELSPWIRVGIHHRTELPIAFFSPDTQWRSEPDGPLTALRLGPSISLFAGSFWDGSTLRSPLDLRIDERQPYLEALFEAYLQLLVFPADKGYSAVISHRAGLAFPEVPKNQQVSAYLDALAAFGSDIMTIAIQIEESTRKHRARGSDLCRFANSTTPTLYTIWRRDFTDSQYPGQYKDGHGAWRNTFGFLAPEDKMLFVERVLEGRWNGDPRSDFCL